MSNDKGEYPRLKLMEFNQVTASKFIISLMNNQLFISNPERGKR